MNHLHVILSYKHEDCWESETKVENYSPVGFPTFSSVPPTSRVLTTENKDFVRAVLYCLV